MSKNQNGKKKKQYSFNFLNRVMFLQFVIMLALCVFITNSIAALAKEDATNFLKAVTDERAKMVTNYISTAELMLEHFSRAEQVQNYLEEQSESDLKKKAQQFTDVYASSISNLEGLYIADWDTVTLTHSNHDIIGTQIREGDSRNQLHEALLEAGDKVYDTGVIISPAGAQVVSMYKAVYDNSNNPIGFVGMGIYTEGLINDLDSAKDFDIALSYYSVIDVSTGTYIFNQHDTRLVDKLVSIEEAKEVINNVKGKNEETDGIIYFKQDGTKYVSTYTYLPEKGWLVTLTDTRREAFELVAGMTMFMIVFTAVVITVMVVFNWLSSKQEQVNERLLSSIAKDKQTRKSLNNAMFNDVLTDVHNRVKLSMDLEQIAASNDVPYYFVMFNICDFSGINTSFGNDAGDSLLVRTVDTLKENFKDSEIYRTGSDEFVVMLKTKDNSPRQETVIDNVNTVLRQLVIPENYDKLGVLYPKYKIAVIRKTTDIDTSIVTVLKEMTNAKGEAVYGMIDYADLSE